MSNGFLLRGLPFLAVDHSGNFETPVSNVSNDFMGMVAKAAAEDTLIQIGADFGAPVLIDTVAALNCRGATTELLGSNDPTFVGAPFAISLADNAGDAPTGQGRTHALACFQATGPYRYWLVRVNGAVDLKAEVGRLLLGQRYQPARNFSFGVARGAEDLGEVEHSPGGATFRRRARKLRTLGLSWQMLTQAEAEGFSLPLLEEVGNTEYLLACLDPAPHAQRSRRMYFGNLKGDLSLNWRAHDLFEKRLQMQSVI